MNDIAKSSTAGDGPNGRWVGAMMVAAHLAGNDSLPQVRSWDIANGSMDVNLEPVIDVYLGQDRDAESAIRAWASWLGGRGNIESKRWHVEPGGQMLFVRCRYLGVWVRAWAVVEAEVESPSTAVAQEPPVAPPAPPAPPAPAEMGLAPAPHPAEVLGQALVTYPFGEDPQDHAAAHQPPPTDPKSGMYGSIR